MRPARYTARWVLPVTAPPIRDGALLVGDDGRIAAVGPAAAVPRPPDAEECDLGEAALLPGLVNVHGHLELAAFRGLLEDLAFPDWIAALRRLTLAAAGYPPDTPPGADPEAGPAAERLAECRAASTAWSCAEALAAGITTFAATTDSDAALDALHAAGLRGVVYRELFGPDPAHAEQALERLRARIDALRTRETALVRVGISPHAPYTVSDRLYRLAAEYARAEGLPVATHTAESADERLLVLRGAGPFADALRRRGVPTPPRARSPVELLARTGVLELRPLLIHCVYLDGDDIRRIAESGAAVAHCPAANARLGHGTAPLAELLEAGVPVGLGTDSVASNNRLDLLEEARLAQLAQRARLRSPTILPAERLLRLATLDGARALGLDHRIGSLEPGKDADLCAVALDRTHTLPVHDPLAALFHSARASDVRLAAVQGRVLYRDGRHLTLDLPALERRIREAAESLARLEPRRTGA